MDRRGNENENSGIPRLTFGDERVILGDGRYLIFFDFEITWPTSDVHADVPAEEDTEIVRT